MLRAYGAASVRVARRAVRQPRLGREERLVFVVGCPRSGTTFLGGALGSQPGFVDLGEVTPWKATLPEVFDRPQAETARELRRVLERVRRLGLAGGLRGVEQTPETVHVLGAALAAYPEALAVHSLRDGRDVVCSLLERGWLSGGRDGTDDAGLAYGAQARFWVESERHAEFAQASDARRAAWAWRRYVEAARAAAPERTLELRYESLAASPDSAAERLAAFLGSAPAPLLAALAGFRSSSVGRWRRDLSPEQLADVVAEAGPLLRELSYA
ncbi:MAG TPA: sulfotransferase [Gaiellaceae bacterium]|nr:sulfotransferase [Gaiellaceae bacterium]